MNYGYTRISTASQEGNTSLSAQAEEILARYPDAEIISEVFSGAEKRVKFEALIDKMQPGDLLCCTKLDRFCRTTKEGLEYIDKLREKGCSVHLFDVGLIENSPTGRLLVGVCLHLLNLKEQKRLKGPERAKKKQGRIRILETEDRQSSRSTS